MSLVKLQVRVKQKKGRQWMDGDNEDGAKASKLSLKENDQIHTKSRA